MTDLTPVVSESTVLLLQPSRTRQDSFLLRLPDDAIFEIYLWLARISKPKPHRNTRDHITLPGTLAWINLTHVSSRLRELGIELPFLWANDICALNGRDAFDTFLARSRNAPLQLRLSCISSKKLHIEELHLTLPQAGSLTSRLDTRFHDGNDYPEADELLHALRMYPPTRMETMDLTFDVRWNMRESTRTVNKYPFPAPNMAHDRLYGCFVPFRAPNLRSLTIRQCREYSVTDLCILLRELPRLERLAYDVYCTSPGGPTETERTEATPLAAVYLPQLKSFQVSERCTEMRRLAEAMQCPIIRSTQPQPIYIGLWHVSQQWSATADRISEVCAAFRSRLVPTCNTRSMALTIPLIYPHNAICYVLLGDVWDPAAQALPSVAYRTYALRYSGSNWVPWYTALSALIIGVTSSTASEIRTFYALGHMPPRSTYEHAPGGVPDVMRDALLGLHAVQEVYLSYVPEGSLDFLSCPGDLEPTGKHSNGVVFPLLEKIIVDNTNRNQGWSRGITGMDHELGIHYDSWQADHVDNYWWTRFCAMLAGRAARGYKLHCLVLRGRMCHFAQYSAKTYPMGLLHNIDLPSMMDLADEIVDERIGCGLDEEVP